jgi:outer membrane receptor protein involved in Fe transport
VFGGTPTGSHFEFNSLDGVRVQTVGSNAEMPRRGLLVDMLTKSGGNEFHFGAHWGYSNSRLQGNNVDDNLRARGVSKLPEIHYLNDLSGNGGGRIIRNKLWFYLSGRQQARDLELLGAFYDDGRPILLVSRAPYHVEKLSYQMNQAHKIIFFNHYMEDFDIRDASVFRPAESRQRASFPYHYRKIEWQGVRGNSLMISAQQGYFGFPNAKRDGVSPGKPATIDIATQFVTGDHLDDGFRANYQRHHSKAVVSWYRPDLIAGSHEIKGGVDYVHSISATRNVPRAGGEYQLRFNNGAPFQLNTQNTPNQSVAHDSYLGLYAQDSWSIARRLTLNLGLRFDRNAGWVPEQCREAAPFAAAGCFPEIAMRIFNAVGPRVGASYDVFGNGKMAIKGSYGRFNHMP